MREVVEVFVKRNRISRLSHRTVAGILAGLFGGLALGAKVVLRALVESFGEIRSWESGKTVILIAAVSFVIWSFLHLRGRHPGGLIKAMKDAYHEMQTSKRMLKLAKVDIPTITAVNGPAAGVGCSIALASDFAIAGKSAYFLQAFVNIGLVPDGGASWMLTRLIGKARATEMMLLGEKIHGEKAAEWGLIYKCVEDAALMDEALRPSVQGWVAEWRRRQRLQRPRHRMMW